MLTKLQLLILTIISIGTETELTEANKSILEQICAPK